MVLSYICITIWYTLMKRFMVKCNTNERYWQSLYHNKMYAKERCQKGRIQYHWPPFSTSLFQLLLVKFNNFLLFIKTWSEGQIAGKCVNAPDCENARVNSAWSQNQLTVSEWEVTTIPLRERSLIIIVQLGWKICIIPLLNSKQGWYSPNFLR
jgi:hypothetical protein